jgi:uncharacterized protein
LQLYAGSSADFIEDAVQRRIAEKIGDAFYDYFRFRVSASEFNSWRNSLAALASQFRYSGIMDHGVVLEMQLPYSSARLDCLIFGKSPSSVDSAVLVELKQWTEVRPSEWDECVESVVGGGMRKVLHPCVQATRYVEYLADSSQAFHPGEGIGLFPCAWLHNMHPGAMGALTATPFRQLLKATPLFVSSDADKLTSFLQEHVGQGAGIPLMERAIKSKHAPSRKLLAHTAKLIAGEPTYRLIDDQVVAFNAVLSNLRRAMKSKTQKAVVIVKGGPGTGKSVIALNLLGTLAKLGINAHHATGSKAFTENLWRVLKPRTRAHIRFFNNYGQAERDSIDVLLADEAHRIRNSSNHRFTPVAKRSERSQIDELIEVARVSVFFIDDHQAVRPGEVGSTTLLREAAIRFGARCDEIDLRTQFRCAGSDEYIDWLDQLLEIRKTGVTSLPNDAFQFEIIEEVEDLDRLIKGRVAEGYDARLMAGYCWPWSEAREDGTLVDDVIVGAFSRPWNARPEAKRLAKGIPTAQFWASDPGGTGQVGCVYTAQGFEFDYAGVIWGPDLVIRDGKWVGQPSASRDHVVKTRAGARFTDCVKNTYRVLMTRGLKGCYLSVIDDETRAYITSRMKNSE